MKRKVFLAQFIKIKDGEKRIISAYASTPAVDSYGDIVQPTAFEDTMMDYMKNPIVMFGHEWWSKPIGKVIKYEIRSDGLWVEIQISMTAEDIWQLIKEGILRGLSIGFDLPEDGYEEMQNGGLLIKRLKLLEISIVNIPANPDTLIESAKAKNINLKSFNIAPSGDAGAKNKGGPMDPEEIKKMQDQLETQDKKIAALSTQLGTAEKKLADIKVNENVFNITDNLVKANQESQAAFKEALEKSQEGFFKKYEEYMAEQKKQLASISKPSKFQYDVGYDSFRAMKIRDTYELHAKMMAVQSDPFPDKEKRLIDEFQKANDELYTAIMLQRMGIIPHVDIKKSLYWETYQRLASDFRKALDTQTSGEGSEWIPVGYSNQLYERVQSELVVANLFDAINMTAPTMYIPTDLTQDTAYYISENLNDIGELIRAKTPTSSRATLTAKKFGVRIVASQEEVEDSLFALVPWLLRRVQKACARAIEDVTLNGDDASTSNINGTIGTHMYVYDARYAMDGLRVMTQSSAKKDFNDTGSAYTIENIRAIRALMGEYGRPDRCLHLLGLKLYIKLLSVKDSSGANVCMTVEKLGPQATILTGQLAVLDGSPVIPSAFMKEDLNASGVYDGSTVTKTLHMIINPDGFLRGFRRTIKVAQAQDIDTDQYKVVATVRYGFCCLTGTSLYPVAFGYDINHS